MQKVARISILFWVMKICATTLGETAGDLLSMTLNLGYGRSSMLLIGIFFVTLVAQLAASSFIPILYWTVILSTSTAGTTMSDYMDRTLELGYATGSVILLLGLIVVLALWFRCERSLSVSSITTRRVEIFYWTAILFSNTLGTAVGDYLADDSGLGFLGGAVLIGSAIAVIALLSLATSANRVFLFWMAFVLTRPFGAAFGDLLTKPIEAGGLNLGTKGASLVLLVILVAVGIFSSRRERAFVGEDANR